LIQLCPHCRKTVDVPWENTQRESELDPPPVQRMASPVSVARIAPREFKEPWVVSALRVISALCVLFGAVALFPASRSSERGAVFLVLAWTAGTMNPISTLSAIVHYLAYSAWVAESTYDHFAGLLRRDTGRNGGEKDKPAPDRSRRALCR